MPDQRVPEARGWERRLALLALPLLMRTRSCRPSGRSRRLERTADAKLSAGATAVGAHDRDHPLLTELVSAAKGSRQRLRTSLPRSRNQVRGEQPGMTIATVAVAITGAVAGVVAPVYAHPDNLQAPAGVVTLKATLTGTYVHAPAGGRGDAAITFAGNRAAGSSRSRGSARRPDLRRWNAWKHFSANGTWRRRLCPTA